MVVEAIGVNLDSTVRLRVVQTKMGRVNVTIVMMVNHVTVDAMMMKGVSPSRGE